MIDLNAQLWQKHSDYYAGQPRDWWSETRKITGEELKRVMELAPLCLVEPHNACMGFNFGITLYDIGDTEARELRQAVIAHGDKPPNQEPLLSITGHHTDTRFAKTWEKLSPLSHNANNAALLAEFGFDPLRERTYYDY